jgi:HSP20 family protein
MLVKRDRIAPTPSGFIRDPFSLLRDMTSEFDRLFGEPAGWRWSQVKGQELDATPDWIPQIDMFEKDNRLVTRVDLPGMKKEDVQVDVTNGFLTIAGERKRESEEKKDRFYRSEREHGSFYRAIALPEGVKLEDVKATFVEGVLEVSVPVPVRADEKPRRVQIEDGSKAAKTAA